MILQIILKHNYFGGEAEEIFYIGPDELEAGADITSHIQEQDRQLLRPFTAHYVDDDRIEITCRDKTVSFSVWEEGLFDAPCVWRPSRKVIIEGEEYGGNHEIRALVKLIPHIRYINGRDQRSENTHSVDNERNSSGDRSISEYAVINEWDSIGERPLSIRVEADVFNKSATDGEAALRVAQCFQEQHPEALEVIAEYMLRACQLGSEEAEEWLKDWHCDDGRFDAYC